MKIKSDFEDDGFQAFIKEKYYKSKFQLDADKPIFEEECKSDPFDVIKPKKRGKK